MRYAFHQLGFWYNVIMIDICVRAHFDYYQHLLLFFFV